jgi:flagellar protein FliO/FliZ
MNAMLALGVAALGVAPWASAQTATLAPAAHMFAAPQTPGTPVPAGLSGLGQVTFALLLVLAAVFAVAWLVRRVRGLGNRMAGAMDVLAEIPLGPKERAVLLKVGQAQILVGVAPGQVSTLHVLAEPIELAKPATGIPDTRPSFRALLLRSLGK